MTDPLSTDLLEQRAASQRQRLHDSVIELRQHLDRTSKRANLFLAGFGCGRCRWLWPWDTASPAHLPTEPHSPSGCLPPDTVDSRRTR